MGNEIKLNPFDPVFSEQSTYIGWSPVRLTVSGRNSKGNPDIVRLTSKSLTDENTQLVFKRDAGAEPADELVIELQNNGEESTAECLIAGKFQSGRPHNGASPEGKDVAVQAAWVNNPTKIKGSLEIMIRVRRDAETLTDKARKDFTNALAELNGYGKGIYVTDFVAMHVAGASESQHGDSHFLPWHRLYLLDLERQLQRVCPAVTLPYWRFDKPAPKLFSENFLGATDQIPFTDEIKRGTSNGLLAKFTIDNKLSDWKIGNRSGIERAAVFNTKTEPAPGRPSFRLINEAETLAFGGDNNEFGVPGRGFARMEGTPHGAAHVSFDGFVNDVPMAPQDPLFFLLHCNVDRLWAMWQFLYRRDFQDERSTYPYQNKLEVGFTPPTSIGMEFAFNEDGVISEAPRSFFTGLFPDEHKLVNSYQWPWDDTWSKPFNLRPPGTRSRSFTESRSGKSFSESGGMPSIADALDAYGYQATANYLGFAYDDVPFDHQRAIT